MKYKTESPTNFSEKTTISSLKHHSKDNSIDMKRYPSQNLNLSLDSQPQSTKRKPPLIPPFKRAIQGHGLKPEQRGYAPTNIVALSHAAYPKDMSILHEFRKNQAFLEHKLPSAKLGYIFYDSTGDTAESLTQRLVYNEMEELELNSQCSWEPVQDNRQKIHDENFEMWRQEMRIRLQERKAAVQDKKLRQYQNQASGSYNTTENDHENRDTSNVIVSKSRKAIV